LLGCCNPRALADAVASPQRCLELHRDGSLLENYDLDNRERRRLLAIVGHEGMSHNCTLNRANQLTPLARSLPRTCDLLGDRLMPELEAFWAREPNTEVQFKQEAERFAHYLSERCNEGAFGVAEELAAVLCVELSDLDRQLGLDSHF
jgi:hypothetical protein